MSESTRLQRVWSGNATDISLLTLKIRLPFLLSPTPLAFVIHPRPQVLVVAVVAPRMDHLRLSWVSYELSPDILEWHEEGSTKGLWELRCQIHAECLSSWPWAWRVKSRPSCCGLVLVVAVVAPRMDHLRLSWVSYELSPDILEWHEEGSTKGLWELRCQIHAECLSSWPWAWRVKSRPSCCGLVLVVAVVAPRMDHLRLSWVSYELSPAILKWHEEGNTKGLWELRCQIHAERV